MLKKRQKEIIFYAIKDVDQIKAISLRVCRNKHVVTNIETFSSTVINPNCFTR